MSSRLSPIEAGSFNEEAAAHLLRRAVIGVRAEEVVRAEKEGLAATLNRLFTTFDPDVSTISHLIGNDVISETSPNDSPRGLFFFEEKDGRYSDFRQWWSRVIVTSPLSIQERLVLLWHMHFATSCNGAHHAEHCYDQIKLIRENALGHLPDLVQSVTLDFAMQAYLDGLSNSWTPQLDAINENHAREFLEIHMLGHLGRTKDPLYTQADVVAIAHAFSGHHKSEYWLENGDGTKNLYRRRVYIWMEDRWNPAPMSVFGQLKSWRPKDIVPMMFTSRSTDVAMWFARRLCTEFCAIESELLEGDVKSVADLLIQNDFHLESTLRTLLSSNMFFDPNYRMRLVRPPMNLLLGMMRTFNTMDVTDFTIFNRVGDDLLVRLSRLGQLPYNPPNVQGWPRDLDWLTATSVTRRIDTCRRFGQGRLTYKDEPKSMIVLNYDPLGVATSFADPNDIDLLATRMCRILLGTTATEVVSSVRLVMLGDLSEKEWNPANRHAASLAGIRRGFTHVLSAPRFQLY